MLTVITVSWSTVLSSQAGGPASTCGAPARSGFIPRPPLVVRHSARGHRQRARAPQPGDAFQAWGSLPAARAHRVGAGLADPGEVVFMEHRAKSLPVGDKRFRAVRGRAAYFVESLCLQTTGKLAPVEMVEPGITQRGLYITQCDWYEVAINSCLQTLRGRNMKFVNTVLAALFITGLLAGQAQATPPREALPPELVTVLDLATQGVVLTPTQRATLLRYPDIAAQVRDPQAAVSGSRSSSDTVSAMATCGWYEAWVTEYSYLGDDLYRFLQHEDYCRDGTNITRVDNRYAIGTTLSIGIRYNGVVGNSSASTPTRTHTGFMQGAFEGCILKYGCWDDAYPWVKIYLRGNGSHTYALYAG